MSPAPLEARDPQRASSLKRKILDRLTDVRRHYRALEAAMGEFGERFDRADYVAAAGSDDPVSLNRVKAVERGLDQLFNYLAELAAVGLQLAEPREPDSGQNARADLRQLRESGVIDSELCGQLIRAAGIRNRMIHDYVDTSGNEVHEAVRLLHRNLPRYVAAYQDWVRAGFPPAVR
jgi:uncharacterized protein YutE (UPF0331/DUF86 family)